MLRVGVKNFQSIAEETVEIAGFSVVVGRSNIGKSALVRAVKAALTGAPADNYVRHAVDCQRIVKGAKSCKCFCAVHIQGPDFDLLWEKGDAVNRYVFNGTEHTVVGKGTPEFLGPAFAPVYIGGDSTPTLLQVADQFRPLFILDRSGTAVADVLSDVAKLDQINDAIRATEKDKRECAATRKVRNKDLKELDQLIEQYAGLDSVLVTVKEVEAMAVAIDEAETRLETLDRYAASLAQLTQAVRALQPISSIKIPDVSVLVKGASQLRALTRWQELLHSKETASQLLEDVVAVEVPEIGGAKRLAEVSRRLTKWVEQLVALKRVFASFKAAEAAVVPDVSGLLSQSVKAQKVAEWAGRLRMFEAAIDHSQKAVAAAEREADAVLAEFKELEVCPTCGQYVAAVAHTHLGAA